MYIWYTLCQCKYSTCFSGIVLGCFDATSTIDLSYCNFWNEAVFGNFVIQFSLKRHRPTRIDQRRWPYFLRPDVLNNNVFYIKFKKEFDENVKIFVAFLSGVIHSCWTTKKSNPSCDGAPIELLIVILYLTVLIGDS